MLAVLITHTLVLSTWLADSEPVQKHANFKIDSSTDNPSGLSIIKVKYIHTEDSIDVSTAVLNSLGTRFK